MARIQPDDGPARSTSEQCVPAPTIAGTASDALVTPTSGIVDEDEVGDEQATEDLFRTQDSVIACIHRICDRLQSYAA